jgi:hypothetical protein
MYLRSPKFEEHSHMKLKLVLAASVLVALPAFAQAPKTAPKPTMADVQKVVQIVSADKAKTKIYCDMSKLGEQIEAAEKKKDNKKAEALEKQADALGQKLGPEYVNLTAGLQQMDPNSKEGKDFMAALDGLDKLCGK